MYTLAVKNVCFNQSKSVPANKYQFKPYYSCHFILTRIYLYALGRIAQSVSRVWLQMRV